MAKEKLAKKGKMLVVSWTVFPWATGSSVIVNNLASSYSKGELVLFGEGHTDLSDDGWSDQFPLIYKSHPKKYVLKRGQKIARWFELLKVIKEIEGVIKKEHIDRILCVFPNDFYLCAAFFASKRTQVPFYSWFHNTYLDNVSGYRKLIARWLQPAVFRASKKVFVMSDGMGKYMGNKYPQYTFEVLRHGFPLPKEVSVQSVRKSEEIKTFVFTGSLNSSCEDATIRLMKVILKNPKFVIHIYSGNNSEDFYEHGIIGQQVVFHNFTPLDRLYKELPKYDVMLLPHGFDGNRTAAEFKTIFPTRTIPLLVSGRPILAHSPKGVFFTDFLNDRCCALVISEKDEGKIEEAIRVVLEDQLVINEIVENAVQTAKLFDLNSLKAEIEKKVN